MFPIFVSSPHNFHFCHFHILWYKLKFITVMIQSPVPLLDIKTNRDRTGKKWQCDQQDSWTEKKRALGHLKPSQLRGCPKTTLPKNQVWSLHVSPRWLRHFFLVNRVEHQKLNQTQPIWLSFWCSTQPLAGHGHWLGLTVSQLSSQ